MPPETTQPIDQDALNLTHAILLAEHGGKINYTQPGDGGTSAGGYQWHSSDGSGGMSHFASDAKVAGLDPNDFSPKNQDKVAYAKIKAMKDKGLTPAEIASTWNSGSPNNWQNHRKVDPTTGKVIYDTPAYVSNVQKYYNQLRNPGQGTFTQPVPNTSTIPPKNNGLGTFYTPPSDTIKSVNGPLPTTPSSNSDAPEGVGATLTNALGSLSGANAPGKAIAGAILPHTQDYKNAQIGQEQEQRYKLQLLKAIHTQTDPAKKQHLTQAYQKIYGGNPTDTNLADINPAKDVTTKDAMSGIAQMGLSALSVGDFEPAIIDAQEALKTGQVADSVLHSGQLAKGLPSVLKPGAMAVKAGAKLYTKQPLIAQLLEAYTAANALKNHNYGALIKKGLIKVVSSGG